MLLNAQTWIIFGGMAETNLVVLVSSVTINGLLGLKWVSVVVFLTENDIGSKKSWIFLKYNVGLPSCGIMIAFHCSMSKCAKFPCP